MCFPVNEINEKLTLLYLVTLIKYLLNLGIFLLKKLTFQENNNLPLFIKWKETFWLEYLYILE